MKKVILSALFLGAFTTANAVGFEEERNREDECHAEACEAVSGAEEAFGDSVEAEQVYDYAFSECMS